MFKVYNDINEELRNIQVQLEAYAEEHNGDVSEFPMLARMVELEGATEGEISRERMLLNLACMALEYESAAEAKEANAERIQELASKDRKKAERIRTFIADRLEPGEKYADDRVAISKRKSAAVQLADTFQPDSLPFEFQRIKVEADKTALKKALEAGQVFPGASLVTRFNLQIK